MRLIREFDEDAVAAGTLEVDDPYFGDAGGLRAVPRRTEASLRGRRRAPAVHARREPAVTDLRACPQTSTGLLISVVSAVLFAVNGTVDKVALQSGLSSLELVSVLSAGAAIVLLGITAVLRPWALRVGWRELGFLAVYGVTGIAMVQWLYFVAIQRMPVGIALLFECTAPLLVALWVRFVQRQPVRSRLWLGAGRARWAVWPSRRSSGGGWCSTPLGCVSALGAAVAALSAYYLSGEHGQRERDPISLMGYSFGFSALPLAVASRGGRSRSPASAWPSSCPAPCRARPRSGCSCSGSCCSARWRRPAGAAGHPPPRCRSGRARRDAGAGERRDHRSGCCSGSR